MKKARTIRVKQFSAERIPNPYPRGKLPWRVYHRVRNAIVRACRRHGPTGPMGERPLNTSSEESCDEWGPGDKNSVYFIVHDQYNDEMYLYMEFENPEAFTAEWLEDITGTLAKFPGWGIGVDSLRKGYILIYADRLLVKGPGFKNCRDIGAVIKVARKQIRS